MKGDKAERQGNVTLRIIAVEATLYDMAKLMNGVSRAIGFSPYHPHHAPYSPASSMVGSLVGVNEMHHHTKVL